MVLFNPKMCRLIKIKKMKNIVLYIAFFCVCNLSQAQTAIDKNSAEGSGLLDFKANTTRAIILPQLLNTTNVVTPGTLFYDTNTRKVMYRDNTAIKDLSTNAGTYTPIPNYSNLITKPNTISIMGNKTSAATGVLILESNTKALILPKVASPHLNIINPEPGTICYDTVKNLLCVYNGKEWAFWGK